MRRLMLRASPGVRTNVGRRRRRFRFADFLVRMWLLNARRRRTLPDAVTVNRFLAPLCVFIFGILNPMSCCAANRGSDRGRPESCVVAAYRGVRIMIID